MLGIHHTSWSDYAKLIEDGPTTLNSNIKNDTFRTFSTDTKFTENVTEDMLIRMLNAFVRTNDGKISNTMRFFILYFKIYLSVEKNPLATTVRKKINCLQVKDLTYVQGMNVLAGPFLLAMPEVEAYYSFSTFIFRWCPLYVQPTMRGVHCGLRVTFISYHC